MGILLVKCVCVNKLQSYLLQSRGVKTDPNAIIIGSSTQQMLINLGQILRMISQA